MKRKPEPLRKCKWCGTPERRFKFGYTNFALGGYCAECINKAMLTVHGRKK